jgi:phosphomannomutase/phosphoglucomutase
MDKNIFREYDIRGVVGHQLDDETVSTVGLALGTFFRQNGAKVIALGYDARESSPRFCSLFEESLKKTGCDVLLIGRVSTPMLYHTLFTRSVDGGIMITGSHNPPDHNGFKVCLGRDALFGSQIQEVRVIAEAGEFASGEGESSSADVMDEYCDDIVSRVTMGPRRIKAVVDSGNGMGGITAVPIYKRLGIDVIDIFTEPDANFPNHHPDPTVEKNLAMMIDKVRETGADVGIAFDGDGDRIGVVDEKGGIIWGDDLLIIFSRAILEAIPGATIIGEVKCSKNLYDDIAARGGNGIMWKAGHSLIKAKMKGTDAAFAGEMSGHVFFADRFYGFDDAAYAGGRLLEIMTNTDVPLSELLADVPETFSTPELRVECSDDIKFRVADLIAEHFSRDHNVNTIDGARIDFEHGWGLVRPSNTQEMLVVRCEADSEEHLNEITERLMNKIAELKAQLSGGAS